MIVFIVVVALLDSLNEQIVLSSYLLASKRPVLQILLFSLVIFVIFFAVGLALVFGLGYAIIDFFAKEHIIDYVLEAIVAVLLFVFACVMKYKPESSMMSGKKESWYKGLSLGAVITLINIPMAFPYFAIITKLLTAHYSAGAKIGYLILFNAIYVLPNFVILIFYLIIGKRLSDLLQRHKDKMEKGLFYFIKVFFIVLAIFLMIDVFYFAIVGKDMLM